MSKPDMLIVDGHAFSWKHLCQLRKAQLEAWRAAQPVQPALFKLIHDSRPQCERTASGRYAEPTLMSLLSDTN